VGFICLIKVGYAADLFCVMPSLFFGSAVERWMDFDDDGSDFDGINHRLSGCLAYTDALTRARKYYDYDIRVV
jgi:hypothetical protein